MQRGHCAGQHTPSPWCHETPQAWPLLWIITDQRLLYHHFLLCAPSWISLARFAVLRFSSSAHSLPTRPPSLALSPPFFFLQLGHSPDSQGRSFSLQTRNPDCFRRKAFKWMVFSTQKRTGPMQQMVTALSPSPHKGWSPKGQQTHQPMAPEPCRNPGARL